MYIVQKLCTSLIVRTFFLVSYIKFTRRNAQHPERDSTSFTVIYLTFILKCNKINNTSVYAYVWPVSIKMFVFVCRYNFNFLIFCFSCSHGLKKVGGGGLDNLRDVYTNIYTSIYVPDNSPVSVALRQKRGQPIPTPVPPTPGRLMLRAWYCQHLYKHIR